MYLAHVYIYLFFISFLHNIETFEFHIAARKNFVIFSYWQNVRSNPMLLKCAFVAFKYFKCKRDIISYTYIYLQFLLEFSKTRFPFCDENFIQNSVAIFMSNTVSLPSAFLHNKHFCRLMYKICHETFLVPFRWTFPCFLSSLLCIIFVQYVFLVGIVNEEEEQFVWTQPNIVFTTSIFSVFFVFDNWSKFYVQCLSNTLSTCSHSDDTK